MAPKSQSTPLPPSVNFHLWKPCNMRCRFCFATFDDIKGSVPKGHISEDESVAVVQRLAAAGFRKLTFAGGEPTLCPWLERLVRTAKRAGMTTMLVSNASRLLDLPWVLDPEGPLDWVALSIDSARPDTHEQLGRALRGKAMTNQRYVEIAEGLREAGVRLKLNTVVTDLNADEDMSDLVKALQPERWKILRMLPVDGQNDGSRDLQVDLPRFRGFVERHRKLVNRGLRIVDEDHEDIRGTYAMVDPGGRFFDDTQGGHTYSQAILEVGVGPAWRQVCFRPESFEARRGRYDWEAPLVPSNQLRPRRQVRRLIALVGLSGAGKDTVGEILATHRYQRVALADGMKRHVGMIFDLDKEQLWGDGRNTPVERLSCTPRELYQRFSDACRQLDPDVWLRPWKREIERRLENCDRVICTDVRTKQEFDAIRALGGEVWRITRPGAGAPEAAGMHATERVLAELPNRAFDRVIVNDGDLDDLRLKVESSLHL